MKIKDLKIGDRMLFFGRELEVANIEPPQKDSPLQNGLLITFNHEAGPSTHFFPNKDAPILFYERNDEGDYDPFDE